MVRPPLMVMLRERVDRERREEGKKRGARRRNESASERKEKQSDAGVEDETS